MDTRTAIRELDEVIARARSVAEREAAFANVLPDCGPRRRKRAQAHTMRAHVHRLRKLRSAMKDGRRSRAR
jgi:hypothetical protein